MRRALFALLACMLLVVGSVSGALAGGGAPRVTTLSGAEEVPPRPGGSGFAEILLNVGQERVCWSITVSDIAPATAAHIHRAAVGANGSVVVPLMPPPTSGSSSGCAEGVNSVLIQEIIDYPARFYVNVHNSTYPSGAVRGQLSNRGQSE